MSNRVLLLGGVRSGRSRIAEDLLAGAGPVRYLTTGRGAERSEPGWTTERIGGSPERLVRLLADAKPDDVLLVDNLGEVDSLGEVDLVEAVRACQAGMLVLISTELGLGGATDAATRANGELNVRVAAACDAVVLAVAGQAVWLRGEPLTPGRRWRAPFTVDGARAAAIAPPESLAPVPELRPGMDLPMPDDTAGAEAVERLLTLGFAGTGLGRLVSIVRFAGATQGLPDPRPWQSIRVLLLRGDHEGGVAAGDPPDAADRRMAQATEGTGPLAVLAAAVNATVRTVPCPPAAPIEVDDALDESTVDAAMAYGWQLAQQAVDEGVDLIALAACGSGGDAAATAVVSLTAGGEPAALLARVARPDGYVDDQAWMARCVAVRDGLQRIRLRPRDPRELLLAVGGGDIAVAAGVIIGATYRRTPVLLDGPVAMAGAMIARDYGAQTRHWLLLPDASGHRTVKHAAEVLGLTSYTDLGLDLGEGGSSLATLPLLNTALTLAAVTPVAAGAEPGPEPDPEAEILRVVADSPTAEMPLVRPGEG